MESIVKKKVVNKPIHQNCQVGIHSAHPDFCSVAASSLCWPGPRRLEEVQVRASPTSCRVLRSGFTLQTPENTVFHDVGRCINPLTSTSNQRRCSRIQGFQLPESSPSDLATWEKGVLLLLAPMLPEPECLSKQRQRKGIPQHGSRDSALMSLRDYGLWARLRWDVIT